MKIQIENKAYRMDNNAKIETIPDEQIKQALASFDPLKTYLKGKFIDMYDPKTWRVGIITQVEPDHIQVHFEGWSEKHDENNVKPTEFRVAPFRRYSKGYTGQSKSSYRMFKYTKEEKKKLEDELKELLANGFRVEDVFKFNQYFRGELFFFIDSLLTSLGVSPPEVEDVPEILEFLELYLKVIVEWLKFSWELKEEFDAAEKWEFLYAVHGRTAVAMSYIEIAETLLKLFGGSIRTKTSFYLLYSKSQGAPSEETIDTTKATEWFTKHFYIKFKELGGTEEILKITKG